MQATDQFMRHPHRGGHWRERRHMKAGKDTGRRGGNIAVAHRFAAFLAGYKSGSALMAFWSPGCASSVPRSLGPSMKTFAFLPPLLPSRTLSTTETMCFTPPFFAVTRLSLMLSAGKTGCTVSRLRWRHRHGVRRSDRRQRQQQQAGGRWQQQAAAAGSSSRQ